MSRVVRFDYWLDPAFDRIVGSTPGIVLRTCPRVGDEDATWHALAEAHVLQTTAAKDELPGHWFATAELLARNGRNLVAQRLAAARGHEHQRIAAVDDMRDDGLLGATELLVAKNGLQNGLRGRHRVLLNR